MITLQNRQLIYDGKDNLSEDEIKELKSLFEKAQENGSVLWKR